MIKKIVSTLIRWNEAIYQARQRNQAWRNYY
jgi:hypothetical protein